MRHTQDDFLASLLAGALQQRIQQDNDGFRTFERKPFLTEVLGVQELFGQESGLVKPVSMRSWSLRSSCGRLRTGSMRSWSQRRSPGPECACIRRRWNGTVGVAEDLEDVAKRHLAVTCKEVRVELPIQVLFRQMECGQIEQGMIGGARNQGIQTGQQMTQVAIAVDELCDAGLQQQFISVTNPGDFPPW